MTFFRRISRGFLLVLFRGLTRPVFRVHAEEMARVPTCGPLIIVMNHVNILEIPMMYMYMQPREVYGLVLADRWKNPILAWVLNTCGGIPLERGGINRSSVSRAIEVLKAGKMLAIMPEGTRSGDGRLQKAHPGVALLAIKSRVPLLPVVTFGGENYKQNLKKLRRTDLTIRVGEPFILENPNGQVSSQALQQMTDSIMQRLAALLPEQYRGAYAGDPEAPVTVSSPGTHR